MKFKNKASIVTVFFALTTLLAGCTSVQTVKQKEESGRSVDPIYSVFKRDAMDFFLTGVEMEDKGEYYLAVNSFLKAYEIDSAAGISYELAKNYSLLGKLFPALQYARSAVAKDPSEKEYYYLLSDIYTQGRQPDSAEAVMKSLIEKYPDDYYSLYRLANLYEGRKPLSAIKIYEKMLDDEPEDWNTYIRLAELYDKTGNKAKATEILEEYLHFNPSDFTIREVLVNYYISLKQYDKALVHINSVLQIYPDYQSMLEAKARVFVLQNDYLNAAEAYLKMVNDPEIDTELKLNIGIVYFEQAVNDPELLKVADTVFSIIETDTVSWITNFYKGAIAILQGDSLAARRRFNEVQEDSYLYLQLWQRIGGVLYDSKKYPEAIFVLKSGLQSFPDDYMLNFILGLSYTLKGDYSDSEPYLRQATILEPNEVNAWSAFAYTLSRLKKDNDAIETYETALELDPTNTDLMSSLAIVYDGAGNQAKSDSLYTETLKLKPNDALAANNFAYSLTKRGIRLQEALELAKIALASNPESPSYLDTYGWVQFQLGNYDTAKVYLEKALTMDGNNYELLDHYGDVMFRLGFRDDAVAFWRKALEFNINNDNIKRKIDRGEI
ncbi:MAG: tetratricopeptide repeat protein [Ignavibacteriales bacterium]|nr:MAG: tetratricopeptide repeat protein [Ignavibacteriaceae bacterium]MBW7873528.1 tetratricopeptide repeat protein [Ignavibacteria bacterium]MCZ2142219.1 tetratricopeptide repeat protein [Ignavibacteriales bacterium]OQY76097.1 MAG: hypothetical protein B6D45_04560 [Ignavibacteriales bacterium UTCHB3]MBV6444953.1 Beta-barrel assembly-enhancing protease [Ignavibacteriaceae bacterium]